MYANHEVNSFENNNLMIQSVCLCFYYKTDVSLFCLLISLFIIYEHNEGWIMVIIAHETFIELLTFSRMPRKFFHLLSLYSLV